MWPSSCAPARAGFWPAGRTRNDVATGRRRRPVDKVMHGMLVSLARWQSLRRTPQTLRSDSGRTLQPFGQQRLWRQPLRREDKIRMNDQRTVGKGRYQLRPGMVAVTMPANGMICGIGIRVDIVLDRFRLDHASCCVDRRHDHQHCKKQCHDQSSTTGKTLGHAKRKVGDALFT